MVPVNENKEVKPFDFIAQGLLSLRHIFKYDWMNLGLWEEVKVFNIQGFKLLKMRIAADLLGNCFVRFPSLALKK